jgi:hypothetical protein
MSPDNPVFSVGKVERRVGTVYTTLGSSSVIRARAGGMVALRVTLNSYRCRFGTKTVLINVKVRSLGWERSAP